MTDGTGPKQPDWLIPGVLVAVGAVVLIALVVVLPGWSAQSDDDGLVEQMERWTSCLRSEGAHVPLVEAVGHDGFRVTVDDLVLDDPLDLDTFTVAFEECFDDAPPGVQTLATVIDGLTNLPFGAGDLEWIGPLLFDLDDPGAFGNPEFGGPPLGEPPLDELCAQLSQLESVVPDLARELVGLCESEPDV